MHLLLGVIVYDEVKDNTSRYTQLGKGVLRCEEILALKHDRSARVNDGMSDQNDEKRRCLIFGE